MPRLLTAALALVPTASLLFLSSSVPLYLKNQRELHHQVGVLSPFLVLFAVTWIVGGLLLMLSGRALFRSLSWAYLLFGPFLLLYRFSSGAVEKHPWLRGFFVDRLVESGVGLLLLGLLFTSLVVVLTRRAHPRVVFAPMALFGVILLGNEVVVLARGLEPAPARAVVSLGSQSPSPSPAVSLGPNVYHVVLDGLSTDVLELFPERELDAKLRGMLFFPDHSAIYHSTVMSLGSMFTSSLYAYDRPRDEYVRTSFGERSFVSTLEAAGYRTIAVVPASDPLNDGPFEIVLHHVENFERELGASTDTFRHLWIVANTPSFLRERLLSAAWISEGTRRELRLAMTGRSLTEAAPVASYLSFRELLAREGTLSARGRYTFIHLLIPHSPYVLDADCSYRPGDREAEPTEQTRCTLEVLAEFLERLEALERFESSLIVVHGDHGAPFRRGKREDLVPSRARSLRTPLFIKPPGRGRDEPLLGCRTEATLLDLAPTVLAILDLDAGESLEGDSLVPSLESCVEELSLQREAISPTRRK